LWTLPPDLRHLRWLVAVAQPQTVYVYTPIHLPPVPTATQVHHWVQEALSQRTTAPWNLLVLAQQYWVSPQVWIAGLRELGYHHPDWPETASVQTELANLETWYRLPVTELANTLINEEIN
jgi:single-stranded-DNA-specific exonuclease